MSKALRPYQHQLLGDVRGLIRQGNREVVAVLPTGGGKTVIESVIAEGCDDRGESHIFLVHRDFLLTQAARTFDMLGIDYGIIANGHKPKDRAVQIGMIDTVRHRLDKIEPPSVVSTDECHHAVAKTWRKVHDYWPNAIKIGFTATPERLDGKGLDGVYKAMALGPTTAELMEMRFLSDYVGYEPSSVDMDEARTVAGDWQSDDVEKEVRKQVIMGDIVGTYLQKAQGLKAVYFCPSIAYSRELAAEFTRRGVRAIHIDGSTPSQERTRIAVDFADGHYDVLTNVALVGEGYDLAAQAGRDDVTIDCVGLVRPTQSLSMHRQQIGRALRPKGYRAVIIDHVGNLARHGGPDEHVEWDLAGRKKRKANPSPKRCKVCSAINPISMLVCIDCGAPLSTPGAPRSGPEEVDGDLIEFDREAQKRRSQQMRAEVAQCKTKEDFIALGKARGYKPQWALIRWNIEKQRLESIASMRTRA